MPGSNLETWVRNHLEAKYKTNFPNTRPNWLKNKETNRNLELDGLNEDFGLAFEAQGRQHYEYVPNFQKDVADFQKQVKHDLQKQMACARRGIRLIIVPPLSTEEEVKRYLDLQLANVEDLKLHRLDYGFELMTLEEKPKTRKRVPKKDPRREVAPVEVKKERSRCVVS